MNKDNQSRSPKPRQYAGQYGFINGKEWDSWGEGDYHVMDKVICDFPDGWQRIANISLGDGYLRVFDFKKEGSLQRHVYHYEPPKIVDEDPRQAELSLEIFNAVDACQGWLIYPHGIEEPYCP